MLQCKIVIKRVSLYTIVLLSLDWPPCMQRLNDFLLLQPDTQTDGLFSYLRLYILTKPLNVNQITVNVCSSNGTCLHQVMSCLNGLNFVITSAGTQLIVWITHGYLAFEFVLCRISSYSWRCEWQLVCTILRLRLFIGVTWKWSTQHDDQGTEHTTCFTASVRLLLILDDISLLVKQQRQTQMLKKAERKNTKKRIIYWS